MFLSYKTSSANDRMLWACSPLPRSRSTNRESRLEVIWLCLDVLKSTCRQVDSIHPISQTLSTDLRQGQAPSTKSQVRQQSFILWVAFFLLLFFVFFLHALTLSRLASAVLTVNGLAFFLTCSFFFRLSFCPYCCLLRSSFIAFS